MKTNTTSRLEVLGRSPLFSGLGEWELAGLGKLATERHLAPGEFLFWEGDGPAWFFIVAAGRVKVSKYSSLGKEFIIAFFGPGEMVGEVAIFEGRSYPATAQAVEETMLLGIAREEFLAFLSTHPQVALSIINILGGRLREAQARLKDLAGERVEQRLAGLLLMLAAKLGPELPFTRQELADMAGTTTETAIRVLARFREGRIIRSARGKIVILDAVKLRLLAEGPPVV